MNAVPDYAVAASNPPPLAGGVAEEVERLRQATREAAFALIEQDWRGAARSAYRAAWHFHRLPRAEQAAFVVSDAHDDDGPMPSTDDWSAGAFVAWLVYRCNRTAEGARRTPRPAYDATGRKITAAERASSDERPIVHSDETDARDAPELTQSGMFGTPAADRGVAGKL